MTQKPRLQRPSEELRQRPAPEDEIVKAEGVRPRFDVDDQRADTINNVGGNQNVYWPDWGTMTPAELAARRVAAVVGLLLFVAGLVLLLFNWKIGLGLIIAGLVVNLALRLLGRSKEGRVAK